MTNLVTMKVMYVFDILAVFLMTRHHTILFIGVMKHFLFLQLEEDTFSVSGIFLCIKTVIIAFDKINVIILLLGGFIALSCNIIISGKKSLASCETY